MRIARQLAMVGPALLMVLPAAAPAEADPDNPPVESVKTVTGDTIRVQRFQRPPVDIDPARLTIAQRKMLRATFGALVDTAQAIPVECPSLSSGTLRPDYACGATSAGEPAFMRGRLAVRLLKLTGGALPTIPAVPGDQNRKLQRVVLFEVRLPALPATEPEPPAGPMVASTDLQALTWAKSPLDYPLPALRQEAVGRMVALCLVQVDLSVSCAQDSFTPPENAPLFAAGATGLYLAGRVEPTLTSGGPAVGARFKVAINFTLPGK